MTRRVVVLRPEPGNSTTIAALRGAGLEPIALPLFEIAPVDWDSPEPAAFDGLLLTSANAVRAAGPGLAALAELSVFAVGAATAAAAQQAGLHVVAQGTDGVEAIVAEAAAQGHHRLLHLAGRDRAAMPPDVTAITVYESREIDLDRAALQPIDGQVVLLHSPRAARRFAALASAIDRSTVRLAALSPAVAEAAGEGWAALAIAPARDDAALVALARRLAD